MIIAEFVYHQYHLNRVYDSDTGFEITASPEVQAAAYQSLYEGTVVRVTTCHDKVSVHRVISTNKTPTNPNL